MAIVTVRSLDAARPRDHEYKLTVDRGLYLRVAPDGVKTWLVRYTVGKQQRQLRLPKPYGAGEGMLSLADARAENARLQAMARSGIDPREEERQRLALETARNESERTASATFREMFEAWMRDGVRRSDGNAEIRRSFEKDVLPPLGDKQVRHLTEHDLRSVIRSMVARGVNRMAVRVFRDIRQLFAWAERRRPWRGLMVDSNPADLLEIDKIVSADYDMSDERDRVLSNKEIEELRDIFTAMEQSYEAAEDKRRAARPFLRQHQLALWICLGTLCRIGELLMAEWSHVDLEGGRWFIPKDNVKGTRGRKQEHLIFLSPFSLQQFRTLHEVMGSSKWCFPGRDAGNTAQHGHDGRGDRHVGAKTVSKQVGDRQTMFKVRKPLRKRRHDDSLVLSGGRNGQWTPHDLRRTGATMMQALGVLPDVIDRCQNHVLKGSRVRRHYLHHDYADEKRDAWNRLGAKIEALLHPCSADRAPPANLRPHSRRSAAPVRPTPSVTGRQQK
jgi:integrase